MKLARPVAAFVSAVLLTCCGAAPHAHASSRVGVAGQTLTLDGRPWWPSGFNAYELATDWKLNRGCGAQVDLDRYFASLPPNSVTRFNAFSSMGLRAIDAVFAAAQKHGQLLVAVLAAGEGGCESTGFKDETWFAGGWTGDYAQWLDTAVGRWGASPALAGWELVGEPEPSLCGSADCGWQQRTCPADAAATLRAFFDAAGARLRAIDDDTPIWEGVAGGDQCGTAGEDYATVGRSPFVDVLDVHDYGRTNIEIRLRQAAEIGKPLVIAEIGRFAGTCLPVHDRAEDLADLLSAQRRAGSAGALFWNFVPDPRIDECTLDIGPSDPLFAVLQALPR